jgi:CheY-like chemotaxis protein
MSQCVARAADPGPASIPPTILVVEDDALIRIAAAEYLRTCRLVVLEAADVDQAVATLEADKAIRLVFADIRLPGPRSGLDLMEILRRDYPQVGILLTSGVIKADETTLDGTTLLRKPYFLFEVERHIKTLLAHVPASWRAG